MSDDQRRFETEQRSRQQQSQQHKNTLETVALEKQKAQLTRSQQIIYGLIAVGVIVGIILLVTQVL